MKLNLKKKGFSEKAALVGSVIAAVCAVGNMVYGSMYEQYADFMVVLSLLAGAALLLGYALVNKRLVNWFCLLGTVAIGFGAGLFLTNSYNVWADAWGNIQQYGSIVGEFSFFSSQGGPVPAAVLLLMGLAAAVCAIISCFGGKETEK